MNPKSLPIVFLLSACGGVHSAQWEPVMPEPMYTVEMDSGSIERLGDTARAWHRESYPAERMDNEGEFSYSLVKSQVQYSCYRRTMTLVRAMYYNDQGVEVRSINRAGLDSAAAIVPDTVEERLFERACRPVKSAKAEQPRKTSKRPVPAADKVAKLQAPKASMAKADDDKPVEENKANDSASTPPQLAAMKGVNAKLNEGKGTESGEAKEEEGADKDAEKGKTEAREPKHDSEKSGDAKHGEGKHAETKRGDAKDDKVADKKAEPHAHWTYEGKTGPETWGKLDAEWSACANGKKQSPIDIRDSVRLDLDNIKFEYKPSPLKIVDNGHTVQVIYVPGSSININGQQFALVQFHFHRPAEERVNGRTFDMVAHLVHKNREGKLAVVAVLMQAAAENPFIRTLWTHLPLDTGVEVSVPTVSIDLNQLLPRSRAYFAFSGSLTTPPCTEGVLWIVLRSPVQVSRQQIGVFAKLYKNNARPLQSANGRLIKESL